MRPRLRRAGPVGPTPRRPAERAPPPRRRGLRRYFLAYVGFLGLNSYGLATLGGFFFFWGWIFVASTVCVLLVKQDEHRAQEGSAGSQLLAAYKEMWLVLQLPAVRSLALVAAGWTNGTHVSSASSKDTFPPIRKCT